MMHEWIDELNNELLISEKFHVRKNLARNLII
jgi:hypothetical protein